MALFSKATGGGTCDSGSELYPVSSFLKPAQECTHSTPGSCFHGACCVLMIDDSAAALSFSNEHRTIALFLLAVWACTLLGGFAFSKRAFPTPRIGVLNRLASSAVLVAASWFLLHALCECAGAIEAQGQNQRPSAPTTRIRRSAATVCSPVITLHSHWSSALFPPELHPPLSYAQAVLLGMVSGFLGDVLLMCHYRIAGIACFAAGHAAYVAAFVQGANAIWRHHGVTAAVRWLSNHPELANSAGGDEDSPAHGIVFGTLLTTLRIGCLFVAFWFGWRRYVVGSRPIRSLSFAGWCALPYTLLLAECTARGILLALLDPVHFVLLGLGVCLFLLSDIAVAAHIFGDRVSFAFSRLAISDFTWLTYGPAQCFIVFSIHAMWLSMVENRMA